MVNKGSSRPPRDSVNTYSFIIGCYKDDVFACNEAIMRRLSVYVKGGQYAN